MLRMLQKLCAVLSPVCLLVALLLLGQPALAWQTAPLIQQPASTLRPVDGSAGRITFDDLIERSGIHFELKNSVSPERYSIETMLGGVAVFDYNNDGLLGPVQIIATSVAKGYR